MWYLLAIIIPILLIGLISMLLSVKILRNQSIMQAESNFDYIAKELDSYANNVFEMSQDFLYSKSIFDIISFDSPVTSQRDADISNFMRRTLLSSSDVQAVNIILGDKQWRSTLRKNDIFGYGTVGYNEIAKCAAENGGRPCWYLSGANDEISGIFFTRTICSPYTGEQKGLIIFEMSRDALSDILSLHTATPAAPAQKAFCRPSTSRSAPVSSAPAAWPLASGAGSAAKPPSAQHTLHRKAAGCGTAMHSASPKGAIFPGSTTAAAAAHAPQRSRLAAHGRSLCHAIGAAAHSAPIRRRTAASSRICKLPAFFLRCSVCCSLTACPIPYHPLR